MNFKHKEVVLVDTRKRGSKYYCIDHLPKRGNNNANQGQIKAAIQTQIRH